LFEARSRFGGSEPRAHYGAVLRLKTRTASAGGFARFPIGADPDVWIAGSVPLGGATRYYQVNYRNAASFCTIATFNITNSLRAVWLL